MIRINLLGKDIIKREYIKEELPLHLLSMLFLLIIIICMQFFISSKISSLNSRVSSLKGEMAKYEKVKNRLTELEKKRTALDKRLKVVETLQQGRIGPVCVLDELATNLPEKRLRLNSLSLEQQGTLLTLEGIALDNETIADFMRRLDSSPYFEGIDLVESAQKVVNGVKLKRFAIKSRISMPKTGA